MKPGIHDKEETVGTAPELVADELVVVESPEPFSEFYERERPGLVALSFALSGSTGFAEDLVQDAFVAAFGRWDRIENPSAWMRRTIANKSVSLFRRRTVEAKHLLLEVAAEPTAEAHLPNGAAELWAEVRALPKRQSQVLALRFVDRASIDEIAVVLGVSRNTVKTHLLRAKQTLIKRRKDSWKS